MFLDWDGIGSLSEDRVGENGDKIYLASHIFPIPQSPVCWLFPNQSRWRSWWLYTWHTLDGIIVQAAGKLHCWCNQHAGSLASDKGREGNCIQPVFPGKLEIILWKDFCVEAAFMSVTMWMRWSSCQHKTVHSTLTNTWGNSGDHFSGADLADAWCWWHLGASEKSARVHSPEPWVRSLETLRGL